MTLCLATKGVLCGRGSQLTPPNPFCPILKFDVELLLNKPSGFIAEASVDVESPSGFSVMDILAKVDTPKGLFIEGGQPPGVPSAFDVEDTDLLHTPMGFAVENI